MKSVRPVTTTIEEDANVNVIPKYSIGDYMEIYNGQYEGHHFWITDFRYIHDLERIEYLYDGMLWNLWIGENSLRLLEKRKVNEI